MLSRSHPLQAGGSSRGARRRQGVLHRVAHRLVHGAAVAETHLHLGRVHVHVHQFGRDGDEQRVGRLAAAVQLVFIGRAHGVGDEPVAHVAAVDEEVLQVGARCAPPRAGRHGLPAAAGPRAITSCGWLAVKSAPSTSAQRCSALAARHCATRRPSCQTAKPTSGRARAWRRTASSAWAISVASVFRNLRRAGVLKNSSCTSTVVPTARAAAVLISEVGPRDGLQSRPSHDAHGPAQVRLDRRAGGRRAARDRGRVLRAPASLLPQMADAADVVRHAWRTRPDGDGAGAQPRGAEAALAAGVHKLTIPVSASEAHSLANVRKTREQMVDEVRSIVALRNDHAPQVPIEAGISTAFGCTLQGAVPEDDVVRLAAPGAGRGRRSGPVRHHRHGQPGPGAAAVQRLRAAIGARTGAAHLHNTRGLGLANCLAAYDVGVRTFDASLAAWAAAPTRPARRATW
jgi:hydroxymethylglutaryl-CoA lyase